MLLFSRCIAFSSMVTSYQFLFRRLYETFQEPAISQNIHYVMIAIEVFTYYLSRLEELVINYLLRLLEELGHYNIEIMESRLQDSITVRWKQGFLLNISKVSSHVYWRIASSCFVTKLWYEILQHRKWLDHDWKRMF